MATTQNDLPFRYRYFQPANNPQFIGSVFPSDSRTGATGSTGSNSLWVVSGTNMYYNTGNIGIGTSTPVTKLDIVGSVQMTGGNLNMFNGELRNPNFDAYKETIFVAAYSGAFVLNCATGNNFAVTLSSGANSVSFINFISTGTLQGVNLFAIQDASGNKTLTYPPEVSWGVAGAPTLSTSANAIDVLNFITWTGGSKILGFVGGKGF